MITDRDTIRKAAAVSEFLMELSIEKLNTELEMPYDDFAYGEALIRWETNGFNALSYFSTDDEFLLFHRKDLEAKFGLEILTHGEAEVRKKNISVPVFMQKTISLASKSDKLN